MITTIIFDIGGVLVTFGEKTYYKYLSKKYGISYEKIKKTFNPLIRKAEYGRLEQDMLLESASKKLKIPKSGLDWNIAFKLNARRDEEVIKVVRSLQKRYPIYLLSNIELSRFQMTRRLLGNGFYKKIFASCYMGFRKPEKRIYLSVLKSIKSKPGECVFIDDREENIRGANSVGIHGILFENPKKLRIDLKRVLENG
jgi:epoxide hydrolase-like predicted phosphatase